jgi:PKD repeat protein
LAQISFSSSDLSGITLDNPTTLQFGPDGRLYVGQQDGTIYAYTITKNEPNSYQVTNTEVILLIKQIQNHDDDGSINLTITDRQLTGLLVTGTSSNPTLYVSSSDSRIGAGPSGEDLNLDTNSGIISKLFWNGASWDKTDIVRGLPRSEENHSTNGLQLDEQDNILYVAQGGHTNAGSPSNNFTFSTEYALSGAILTIDLTAIDNNHGGSYDLPTLDDPTRPGSVDNNDPFGGNDGLNQAKLVPGGPVQIHSPGYRNIYDLVLTKSSGSEGRLYTIDNGANKSWGGHPENEGTANVTNNYVVGEPGSTGPGPNDDIVNNLDNLHYVSGPGFQPIYGGHPNPIRANPSGAGLYRRDADGQDIFELNPTSDWPPVPVSMANVIEGDFQNPGVDDGALYTWGSSTNGLAEYTATNYFGGSITGDLLTASFDNNIYQIGLNADGKSVAYVNVFASGFGSVPLDVTAQGTGEIFEGTVWAVTYVSNKVTVFEPNVPPDNQAPIASFTASPTSGEAPLSVVLDASASSDPDGSIVSYSWDFGNGTSGTGMNSNVTYANPGTFTITLEVTDNNGSTSTSSIDINVNQGNQLPQAAFTATPSTGKAPLVVFLDAGQSSDSDGSIVAYDWDFGNGTNGSGQTANVTYVTAGTYTINLTVTDNNGGVSTKSQEVSVLPANQPPNASFSATPATGKAPLNVSVDASSSTDPDGSIISYDWDFDNGTSGTGASASVVYDNIGSYDITLTVTDDDGAKSTTSISVEVTAVNQPPVASYAITPTSGEAPLVVNMDGSSSSDPDGSIENYLWDFGDGSTGNGVTATKTFNNAGTFTVTLTVTDDNGASASISNEVTVTSTNVSPLASFTASPTSGEAPLTVNVDASVSSDPDGTIVQYNWDFGNGITDNKKVASVTYNNAGSYTITLVVTDNDGGTGTISLQIEVSPANQPPIPVFTSNLTSGKAPLTIELDASESSDSDGTITSYDWDFGNGTNSSGLNTQVTYDMPGTYTITLTLVDNDGAIASVSKNIQVNDANIPPVANFVASPTSGKSPLTISLDASGSNDADGSVVSYDWDFGNGTTGSGSTSTVTYDTDGTYTIVLTVTDNDGATSTTSVQITVQESNQFPVASFTASNLAGVVPLTVSLDASASHDPDGEIASFSWDFGNGSTDSGASTSVTYNNQGNYTITLTVTDNDGASASVTEEIQVTLANQPPVASFTATPSTGDTPLQVYLDASASNDKDGTITSYNWDFGDGNSAMGKTVNVTYFNPGSFIVKLIVIDNNGAIGSTSMEIEAGDLVLSARSGDSNSGLIFYPNPFDNQLILNSKHPLINLVVSIQNLSGQILVEHHVVEHHVSRLSKSQEVILKVPELSPGVYIITFQTDNSINSHRLLKQ